VKTKLKYKQRIKELSEDFEHKSQSAQQSLSELKTKKEQESREMQLKIDSYKLQ